MQGPVLNAFSYDEAHPYAAGQHRGIDIAADAEGETVVAPAAGTVSFAGTVPTSGKSVTIETQDGYSVTLTHLGSMAVARGAAVAEGDAVGTIGPSGTPEVDGPYLHLGIRHTADPNGYVDPLGLLPPVPTGTGTDPGSDAVASQPSSGSASTTASGTPSSTSPPAPPATQPATPDPATRPVSSNPTTTTTTTRVRTRDAGDARERTSQRSAETQTTSRAQGRPETQPASDLTVHTTDPSSAVRRPVVETPVPAESTRLDAGHEIASSVPVHESAPVEASAPETPLPLILNGAASVVAVGAALMAASGRRRRRLAASTAAAQVFDLPPRAPECRPLSRAA